MTTIHTNHGDAKTPDVRPLVILATSGHGVNTLWLQQYTHVHTSDTAHTPCTHCQIRLAADVCLYEGVDQFPRNPKVAQFDVPSTVDEDIGWLHI